PQRCGRRGARRDALGRRGGRGAPGPAGPARRDRRGRGAARLIPARTRFLRCAVRLGSVQRDVRTPAAGRAVRQRGNTNGTMTTSDGQGGDHGAGADKGAPQDQQPGGAAPDAPALAIIEAFGGIRPMAKALGLAVSTVQGWKERAAIPANRHDQIRAAARDNNIALDAEVLRASAGEGGGAQPQNIAATAEKTSAEKPADTTAEKPAH